LHRFDSTPKQGHPKRLVIFKREPIAIRALHTINCAQFNLLLQTIAKLSIQEF
jgi:hypothetical protein